MNPFDPHERVKRVMNNPGLSHLEIIQPEIDALNNIVFNLVTALKRDRIEPELIRVPMHFEELVAQNRHAHWLSPPNRGWWMLFGVYIRFWQESYFQMESGELQPSRRRQIITTEKGLEEWMLKDRPAEARPRKAKPLTTVEAIKARLEKGLEEVTVINRSQDTTKVCMVCGEKLGKRRVKVLCQRTEDDAYPSDSSYRQFFFCATNECWGRVRVQRGLAPWD